MPTQKQPIPPTRWWTWLARPLVRDYEPGYVTLSKEIAKKVGRAKPWAHSAFTRFVATGQCSDELAAGISTFFKLPRPAFLARSAKEAFEMEAVASKYDNVPVSEIETEIADLRERIAEREHQLEIEAQRTSAKTPGSRRARQHG